MGRKSRAKAGREGAEEIKREPANAPPAVGDVDNIRMFIETPLAIGAVITISLVVLWFALDVNRVFDVPKALALKVGGSGVFLVWLVYGLFGKGFAWRSIRLFVAPVAALIVAVGISTVLSIDPWMSLVGVYERQFGFQGLLSCAGLFVVTATCLRSRRAAIATLVALMMLGAIVSAHAWLQSLGLDPWGFFKKPHNKVYATLGNATFAGNSLALIFPISMIIAIIGTVRAGIPAEDDAPIGARVGAWVGGIIAVLALMMAPGYYAGASEVALTTAQFRFKMGCGFAVVGVVFLGLVGSGGHHWFKLDSPKGRRLADSGAAGGLVAFVGLMVIGLLKTRTRGAWVGTGVAVLSMLLLLPVLFRQDAARFKRAAMISWGSLAASAVGLALFVLVLVPDHLISHTIKSIPYAFMPQKTKYGVGQGTRPFLWKESPRVLFDHGATLDRVRTDREDYAKNVPAADRAPDFRENDWLPAGLRKVLVYPFGIGIETYRYAFMSHKSKKLEALDPMTNHDNPHNNYLYVLASGGFVGLLAYLWLLWRLLSISWRRFWSADREWTERAVAYGVVLSFFSYAVYSIAGFDSVACSVFLYMVLGAAATYFEPSEDEPRRPIITSARQQWRQWRGQSTEGIAGDVAPPIAVAVLLVIGLPLAHTMYTGKRVHAAERAFVGDPARTIEDKLNKLQAAIDINPEESFYRQSLGGAHTDAANRYRQAAVKAQREGNQERAKQLASQAQSHALKSERALYAALNHAWAPENIFISMFQVNYAWQKTEQAEQALERGLQHSPHLAPVRANLAVLKLTRKGYEEALADSLWVLDIAPTNLHALRTAGRAYHQLGQLDKAKAMLDAAAAARPDDPMVKAYTKDLAATLAAKNSTTAARGG